MKKEEGSGAVGGTRATHQHEQTPRDVIAVTLWRHSPLQPRALAPNPLRSRPQADTLTLIEYKYCRKSQLICPQAPSKKKIFF